MLQYTGGAARARIGERSAIPELLDSCMKIEALARIFQFCLLRASVKTAAIEVAGSL